MSDISS